MAWLTLATSSPGTLQTTMAFPRYPAFWCRKIAPNLRIIPRRMKTRTRRKSSFSSQPAFCATTAKGEGQRGRSPWMRAKSLRSFVDNWAAFIGSQTCTGGFGGLRASRNEETSLFFNPNHGSAAPIHERTRASCLSRAILPGRPRTAGGLPKRN